TSWSLAKSPGVRTGNAVSVLIADRAFSPNKFSVPLPPSPFDRTCGPWREFGLVFQHATDLFDNLFNGKGLALHLVQTDRVAQELAPQDHSQLAQVQLGHQHLFEPGDDVAQVGRKRVE